jgi:hypothetical protein
MGRLASRCGSTLRAAPVCAALAVASCNGTTGDKLLSFTPYARGATGASQPFVAGAYTVQLTRAKMRIGAVYVDESPQSTTSEGPVCVAPDIFAAQVPGGVEVDLLNDQPQIFSVYGQGTEDIGRSWQMWLTDGDINEQNRAHVVDVQGVATRAPDGASFSFAAVVTINDNRLIATVDPAQPGNNPICRRRIVEVGGLDATFFDGGAMYVTVDPRRWFALDIDFAKLPSVDSDTCLTGDPTVPLDPSADFGSAAVCIPNTDYATGDGAIEGQKFLKSILAGGPSAYSLSFR